MNSELTEAVAIRREDGSLYLIAQSELSRYQVPATDRPAVEQALSAGEVSGYVLPTLTFSTVAVPALYCRTADGEQVPTWDLRQNRRL